MTSTNNNAPRANLYTFAGSIWGSVPRIGLIEKGYGPDDLDIRSVDLLKGENFSPTYLRVNSAGTVPTLVVPLAETTGSEVDTKFRAITNSVQVLEFLDSSRSQQILEAKGDTTGSPAPVLAPASFEGKTICDEIIALVHAGNADGNFLLLAARTPEELAGFRKGLQGTFVKGRLDALNKFKEEALANRGGPNPREEAVAERLLKWYDDKLASEAPLVGAYLKSDAEASKNLIALSLQAWSSLVGVLDALEAKLTGPYALGDQVCLADVHLMAWFARIFAVASGLPGAPADEVKALNEALAFKGLEKNGTLGPKTTAYWALLKQRPSFKSVYADGLH